MIPIVGRDLGVIVLIPNESRALRPKSKPTARFLGVEERDEKELLEEREKMAQKAEELRKEE